MGSNRSVSSPPYWKQRIPAPPAAARFDAVFVHAVADLSAMLRSVAVPAAPADDPA